MPDMSTNSNGYPTAHNHYNVGETAPPTFRIADRLAAIRREVEGRLDLVIRIQNECFDLQKQLDRLRNSTNYQLGRIITREELRSYDDGTNLEITDIVDDLIAFDVQLKDLDREIRELHKEGADLISRHDCDESEGPWTNGLDAREGSA